MAEYIEQTDVLKVLLGNAVAKYPASFQFGLFAAADEVRKVPNADVVEVETIKAWLYEMAMNNVGVAFDGDFSDACEEIISRLDGLRNFARERTPKERGGEK